MWSIEKSVGMVGLFFLFIFVGNEAGLVEGQTALMCSCPQSQKSNSKNDYKDLHSWFFEKRSGLEALRRNYSPPRLVYSQSHADTRHIWIGRCKSARAFTDVEVRSAPAPKEQSLIKSHVLQSCTSGINSCSPIFA